MKKVNLILILFIASFKLFSQKPILDSSTFGRWPTIKDAHISNDGSYAFYTLKDQHARGGMLIVQSLVDNWKREFEGGTLASFTSDSRFAVFMIPGDTLCLLDLGAERSLYTSDILSFRLPEAGDGKWLAFTARSTQNRLTIRNLYTEEEKTFDSVKGYLFNATGSSLLLNVMDNMDSLNPNCLKLLDLSKNIAKTIWKGKKLSNYVFDHSGTQLAFITNEFIGTESVNSLWYYNYTFNKAVKLFQETPKTIESNLKLNSSRPTFSDNGKKIYFQLIEKLLPKTAKDNIKVDIWTYNDKEVQPQQLLSLNPNRYRAVINLKETNDSNIITNSKSVLLERGNERVIGDPTTSNGDYVFLGDYKGISDEFWWQDTALPAVYVISTLDGSKRLCRDKITNYANSYFAFPTSPSGKWMIFFDNTQKSYFSFNVENGIATNVTRNIPYHLYNENGSDLPETGGTYPVGVGAWMQGDSAILVYDDYDIWKIDPAGIRAPINVTNGYGRIHHIKFRLVSDEDNPENIAANQKLLLTAFNPVTKYNGFYSVDMTARQSPQLLTMGPYNYFTTASQVSLHALHGRFLPLKAKNANIWIVQRMSAVESPNYFITKDFKSYIQLSKNEPESNYNWLTTELIRWRTLDGTYSTGILYKPENFNSEKKYPVIFNYYEQRSDELNYYLTPNASISNINIPYFVSRGYLVFIPDIHYKLGLTGKSVLNSVVSAAKYLSKFPWVDSSNMAVQGHSFGGFETNFIITHSHLFKAACEAAGVSDLVSSYNSLDGWGTSRQPGYEFYQGRMNTNLWSNPSRYFDNSPILSAENVTTPLLMMHNKNDGAVPFQQGVELFLALRRLHKRVWLLQYDGEDHWLAGEEAALDFTIRLTEYFDYYLKGCNLPVWMEKGIRARDKGQRLEYQLDENGKLP